MYGKTWLGVKAEQIPMKLAWQDFCFAEWGLAGQGQQFSEEEKTFPLPC